VLKMLGDVQVAVEKALKDAKADEK